MCGCTVAPKLGFGVWALALKQQGFFFVFSSDVAAGGSKLFLPAPQLASLPWVG